MGDECTKAMRRRGKPFIEHFMQGQGIDIGAGSDGVSKWVPNCRDWDWRDGDAQLMESVPDHSFDFVHSSHCLEHMRDAGEALTNWWRILKPGGYLIVVVPDWGLYEQHFWPSRFNNDHKQRFSITEREHGVIDPRTLLPTDGEEIKMELLESTMPPIRTPGQDYSCQATCEPAIEWVWRKL